jgi:predicted outer membrane protein
MQHRARLFALALSVAAVVACRTYDRHEFAKDPDARVLAPGGGAVPTVDDLVAVASRWPERPRLAAHRMAAKYGPPSELSANAAIWHDVEPFRRITVVRDEIPHDFPTPHTDFLSHTVAYAVPLERVADVLALDGSLIIDRTAGELTARCDHETRNVLALNLAHRVSRGDRDVDVARESLARALVEGWREGPPELARSLAFSGIPFGTAQIDEATLPGGPVRVGARAIEASSPVNEDLGEILGLLIALDETEVRAMVAAREVPGLPKSVHDFAVRLHQDHGAGLLATMELATRLGVTPLETRAVDAVRRAAAARLAPIVLLSGDEFARAFLDALVEEHAGALELLDQRVLPALTEGDVRRRALRTREMVGRHLGEARRLRAELNGSG